MLHWIAAPAESDDRALQGGHRRDRIRGALKGVDRRGAVGSRAGWGMAKIELPECWLAWPNRCARLMAEVERDAHADGSALPDLAAVSARWTQVRDAIPRNGEGANCRSLKVRNCPRSCSAGSAAWTSCRR